DDSAQVDQRRLSCGGDVQDRERLRRAVLAAPAWPRRIVELGADVGHEALVSALIDPHRLMLDAPDLPECLPPLGVVGPGAGCPYPGSAIAFDRSGHVEDLQRDGHPA